MKKLSLVVILLFLSINVASAMETDARWLSPTSAQITHLDATFVEILAFKVHGDIRTSFVDRDSHDISFTIKTIRGFLRRIDFDPTPETLRDMMTSIEMIKLLIKMGCSAVLPGESPRSNEAIVEKLGTQMIRHLEHISKCLKAHLDIAFIERLWAEGLVLEDVLLARSLGMGIEEYKSLHVTWCIVDGKVVRA